MTKKTCMYQDLIFKLIHHLITLKKDAQKTNPCSVFVNLCCSHTLTSSQLYILSYHYTCNCKIILAIVRCIYNILRNICFYKKTKYILINWNNFGTVAELQMIGYLWVSTVIHKWQTETEKDLSESDIEYIYYMFRNILMSPCSISQSPIMGRMQSSIIFYKTLVEALFY